MFKGHIFKGSDSHVATLGFTHQCRIVDIFEQVQIVIGWKLIGEVFRNDNIKRNVGER